MRRGAACCASAFAPVLAWELWIQNFGLQVSRTAEQCSLPWRSAALCSTSAAAARAKILALRGRFHKSQVFLSFLVL